MFRDERTSFVSCLLIVVLAAAVPRAAAAECLEAVFFDLGDTLVENDGGLFVLRDGAQETLDGLQAFGTALGVITNVPAGWTIEDLEAVLADPSILDEFEVVVLSSQAPAPKPDPAIYTFAHSQLADSVPIGRTAFVGETLAEIADLEVAPTQGARAAGMVGIHLSDAAPSPLADFTVASDDLPAVLQIVVDSCTVFSDGFESGDTGAWSAPAP